MSSYLEYRNFREPYEEEATKLHPIKSGVPQANVLGLMLYLLFTADLPSNNKTTTSTFADDTAILLVNRIPILHQKFYKQLE